MDIIIVTCVAQNKINETQENYKIRESQYMYSFARLFSYKLPIYCVVSETYNLPLYYPISQFPFKKIVNIESTIQLLGNVCQSMKEFISLKYLVQNMDINDNTWIIKTSGRYLLEDDTFVTLVKNTNNSTEAIIRSCDNDTQIYTFLFAMRFKHFKNLFQNFMIENNVNLERFVYLYILEFIPKENIKYVDHLGIFCNIACENTYLHF